ncbi:protein NETWORKED 3C [Syzygium oleosum]|uniref:protein NETWORKED 3C n=1 Tax=Syzygium oleosum TaxID=219896 RepID=UPI0011D1BAEC|nr:protein NETWORKED 3C [Syzygium oleosum]XP_056170837.1 protein NETWORKED 3C [Syzygium oleosum]
MVGMVMTMKKQPSHSQWWWLDGRHNTTKRSPWLQSTLSELDDKTETMLKLIEGDADSFAQRAEMYYKKRPELMSMVEDFYRAHRLLAERYDQLKSEAGTRLLTTVGSPFSCNKYRHEKSMSAMDQNYDSYSESFEHGETTESEVEDLEEEEEVTGHRRQETESTGDRIEHKPCQKNETVVSHEKDDAQVHEEAKEEAGSCWFSEDEVKKLKEEIERLKEENSMQKEKLVQKDEEKREVIRQLSLTVGVLKDENVRLKKHIVAREAKKFNLFEFDKFKGGFLAKLFNGSSKSPPTVVAL